MVQKLYLSDSVYLPSLLLNLLGTVQGTSQERSVEVTKSRHSTDLRKQILQKSKEESQKSALKSDRDAVMGRNNGSKHSALGKKPDFKSDLWWMKLPYVLVRYLKL